MSDPKRGRSRRPAEKPYPLPEEIPHYLMAAEDLARISELARLMCRAAAEIDGLLPGPEARRIWLYKVRCGR